LIQGGGIATSGSKVAQPKTSESIANTAQQSNSTTSAQTNTASSQTAAANAASTQSASQQASSAAATTQTTTQSTSSTVSNTGKANSNSTAADTSKTTISSSTKKEASSLGKKYEAVQSAKTAVAAKQEASDTAAQKADNAKSDLAQSKQITADAQADYNNAKADVDTAQKNYDSAKQNTVNAQKALEQAKADQKAAEDRVNAANKASDDAENAVKTAKVQKEAAEKALADAKTAASSATTDKAAADAKVAEAQKAVDEATQAVTNAQKTADEKYNALLKAQSDLDALNSGSQVEKAAQALKEAQSKESEAQTAYNTAKDASEKATSDLNNAKTNQADAKKALEDAQKAAKQAEDDLAAANSTYEQIKNTYDNAGQKFIESHNASDVSVDSIMERARTTGAVHDTSIMTNIPYSNMEDTYHYISKWDVLNNKHFQDALKSAFSVENIEKDIAFMEEVNADRAKEGKDPYQVDYSVLFDSIFNSAYQSVLGNEFGLYDHWASGLYGRGYADTYDKAGNRIDIDNYKSGSNNLTEEESKTELYDSLGNDLGLTLGEAVKNRDKTIQNAPCYTDNNTYAHANFGGENLAWGWYNDKGEADPVYGWYDYEKETHELNEKYKNDPAKLKEIYNERGGCGHYGAIKSDTFKVMGIGFVDDNAINYSTEGTDNNYGMAFNPDGYHYAYTSAMEMCTVPKTATAEITTVDKVKEAFQNYIKDIKQKLSDAKDALTKAQDAKTKADQAVKDAQSKVNALASTVTDAQAKADAASKALSDARAKLDDAKANTASAQNDYSKAVEADKNLAKAIQAQQKVVDQAKAENDSAQQALSDAKAKQSKANAALKDAQSAQKTAEQKANTAQADVNAKESALNNANAALKDAESAKTKADQEKQDAAANKATKDSNEKDAETNKLTAEQKEQQLLILLNLSKANLADTVAAHIKALPDTDSLTLKDKDTVDTLAKIYDTMTSDTQSLISKEDSEKLDQARQKIAELELTQKDRDAANAVADQIGKLPKDITVDNASSVYDAQKAYNNLSDSQKNYVGQDAKDQLADAIKAADKATADAVSKAINALPDTITLNDKDAVKAARDAYDALTPEAKAQVDTTRLTAAEKAIQSLEKQKADNDAAKKVDTLINALPKHPTAKDRDGIMNVYRRYQALSNSAKAMLPEGDLAKLFAAMKAANAANIAGTNGNAAVVTAKTANSTAAGSPKTGDNTAAGAEAAAILAAIAGLGFARRRRREGEENA
jgi:DNA repair exonuclease SbcCD ATPase subunit